MLTVGSLCTGYGGLDLGFEHGYDTNLAFVSDNNKFVNKILQHNWPDIPNLGDLTQITDPPKVDVITAGFPCQPVSHAGMMKGTEDKRWLIDDVVRVSVAAEAKWLILENVFNLKNVQKGQAMQHVEDALNTAGYTYKWIIANALDLGACHRRRRWYCVATAPSAGPLGAHRVRQPAPAWEHDGQKIRPLPTPTSSSFSGSYKPTTATHVQGITLTDALMREVIPFETYLPAVRRHEKAFNRTAPPKLLNGTMSIPFIEWMLLLPENWVWGTGLSVTQGLKITGNGVMPPQVDAALKEIET